MAVRDQLARWLPPALAQRFNLGQYAQFVQDYYSQFAYAGSLYPLGGVNQSVMSWSKTEEISATLPSYWTAMRRSPPAYAAQSVRALLLSQARLIWRHRIDRHLFPTSELRILEQPWVNGTTGELLARMEWHEGLAGNAYVYRQASNRLRILRPDWVAIVYGSQSEPDDPKGALDGEVVGYMYQNGGFTQGNRNQMIALLPEEIAHWSPNPDPMSPGLGMSWLTPALRDLQGDQAAEEYKLSFFSNGATPNLVIKGLPSVTTAQFNEFVDAIELKHKGSANAFKSLYLTAGADATVIGSNLQQLDLTSITSHGETRISYLSRVPAVFLGIAAGLKGSSLNAGNYGEARRNLADSWYYPTLQDCCAALGSIVNTPGGAQLWFEVADVPFLREDAKDAAEIEDLKATTIVKLVNGGFKPESVLAAVTGQNMTLLQHTGLVSVQLQPPGSMFNSSQLPAAANGSASPVAANGNGAAGRSLATRQEQMTEAPAPLYLTVNVPPNPVNVPITVQPAAPAEVIINNSIEPASITNEFAPPSITLEAPITMEPVSVTNNFSPPSISMPVPIKIEAPITVNLPPEPASQGVDVLYDEDGKVVGTRPRRSRSK